MVLLNLVNLKTNEVVERELEVEFNKYNIPYMQLYFIQHSLCFVHYVSSVKLTIFISHYVSCVN
jgi:hypothetical protein